MQFVQTIGKKSARKAVILPTKPGPGIFCLSALNASRMPEGVTGLVNCVIQRNTKMTALMKTRSVLAAKTAFKGGF